MCKNIGRVAPQDVNVLILGESGTGKELVARAIYHHSKRADRPFLAINCAALPEALIESELFGHERGAFTGADRQRIGKFEQCQDGTIFLDEIGDMPLAAQAKMLRLLQDQTFERVGGSESIRTRVRVIAATNQDLDRRIASGQFRADLFYRLQGVTISLPPLRDRPDDIAELAHHFLFLYNRELGLNVQGFDPEALGCLRAYRWPGNVRELQAVLKAAMLRGTGPLLLPEFLPAAVRGQAEAPPLAQAPAPADVSAADRRPTGARGERSPRPGGRGRGTDAVRQGAPSNRRAPRPGGRAARPQPLDPALQAARRWKAVHRPSTHGSDPDQPGRLDASARKCSDLPADHLRQSLKRSTVHLPSWST